MCGGAHAGQEERCSEEGHCSYDCWQGCVYAVYRCGQLHANRKFGAQEAGVSVSHQLCKEPPRPCHPCCEYLREGLH